MRIKFKAKDHVTMTKLALSSNPNVKSTSGVVISVMPKTSDGFVNIRVRRDGLKTVETWPQSAWRKRKG